MIAAISWFFCSIFGFGFLLALILFSPADRRTIFHPDQLASTLALSLMLGLLTNLALGLATSGFFAEEIAGWIGLCGFIAFLALVFRSAATDSHASLLSTPIAAYPLYALVIALMIKIALAIYAEPVIEWDARSIWFFQAKVIYLERGAFDGPFWGDQIYDWVHQDYPKLSSWLAARFAAFTADGWNEYAPKGALVILAASGYLGVVAVAGLRYSTILLLVGATVVLDRQLWNGYVDGWAAFHACTALGALGRWAQSGEKRHFRLGAAAVGVALCLKNEGQLALLASLVPLAIGAVKFRTEIQKRDLVWTISLAPFVIWTLYKSRLDLVGDIQIGEIVQRAIGIAANPTELFHKLTFLAQYADEHTLLWPAAGTFAVMALLLRPSLSTGLWGLGAVIYLAGLTVIYVGGPNEFEWYVQTTLDRVTLFPIMVMLLGAVEMLARSGEVLRAAFFPLRDVDASPRPNS